MPDPTPMTEQSVAEQEKQGSPSEPETSTAETAEQPPWGDPENFTPEKAWALIQNLRGDKENLKARLAQANTEKETPTEDIAEAEDTSTQADDSPATEETAEEPAEDKEPEPSQEEQIKDLKDQNTQLRADNAKIRALASAGLALDLAELVPSGTDEEIAGYVAKLSNLAGARPPASAPGEADPHQENRNPEPASKEEQAHEFFEQFMNK